MRETYKGSYYRQGDKDSVYDQVKVEK